MSDLDDDLLALADGMDVEEEEIASNNNTTGRHHGEVSEDEDDDYTFLQRKQNNQSSSSNAAELEYPYPFEEFYLNDEDKDRILSLPELEQEEIMYEREQKIKEYKERAYFLNRKREQEKRTAKNAEYSEEEDEDEDFDYQVKPSRAKRLKNLVNRKSTTPTDEEYSEEEEEEYSDDDYMAPKSGRISKKVSGEVEWDEENYTTKEPVLDDYNKIKIGRQFIDKFCFYPGFNNAVVGCYGRVNVSTSSSKPQYRLVKIEKVFIQKPYKFNNSFYTNQYFGVTQGKFRKIFQMNYFSDSSVTESELDKYNTYLTQQKISLAKRQELISKFRELDTFYKQPLTAELMNQQVANRLQLNKKLSGVNSVIEKSILRDKLTYAIDTDNEVDVNKYTKQLKQLEKRMSQYDKHHENDLQGSTKLNFLTQKNKQININNIKTKKQEDEEQQEFNETKDKKSDPFSRLKTKARIYYKDLQKIENEKYLKEQEEKKLEKMKKETQEREERQYLEMIKSKFKKRGGFEYLVKDIKVDMGLEL
ncbi:hypothetical protein QEN19_000867 [Hanseniaspora menglaensis]